MKDVIDLCRAAINWRKARERVCGMSVSDSGYMEALNHLSECEDKLAKQTRKISEE